MLVKSKQQNIHEYKMTTSCARAVTPETRSSRRPVWRHTPPIYMNTHNMAANTHTHTHTNAAWQMFLRYSGKCIGEEDM